VRSSDPPHIIHIEDPAESGMFLRDLTWGGVDYMPENARGAEQSWGKSSSSSSSSSIVGELYEAALSCARSVLKFVDGLGCEVFGGEFWHSCKYPHTTLPTSSSTPV
jgi:hypothetical protein